jgi:hypothetical protein
MLLNLHQKKGENKVNEQDKKNIHEQNETGEQN